MQIIKNLTIGKRITFGFASVIIIALALGIFAFTRLIAISGHSDRIAKQSLPAIEMVYQVQRNAKDQVQLIYKHIGSVDKADMAQLEATMAAGSVDNGKLYDALDRLITDANGRALLDKVKIARAENNRVRALVMDLSRAGTTNTDASAKAYLLGRREFDPAHAQYIAALDAFIDFIKADADGTSKNIQTAVVTSQAGILIGLSLATLAGIGIAFAIIRSTARILRGISSSLSDGSRQVASAAAQVSASSQTLAEGASEQASSLEETSASLEEMASMTRRNAENARQANDIAKQARDAADKGAGDMQTMAAAMAAIKVSSDDIAKIIKTIDEIAFQTNILALNAAVEAARAGEAGMGFAVVADEVRNLAQRCAQAAKETSGKIEGAITKAGQGVEITGKVAAALNDIVAKVRQVDELVTEVAGATREQTDGITQVNTAVGQMDKVTQSNAANAEESAAAAEELNSQAELMKQSVAELLQLVDGQPAAAGWQPNVHSVENKNFQAARPQSKRPAPTNGHANGNGQAPAAAGWSTTAKRRGEIPLDGDFKDF
jgi:methyl-accepting chemotaxis protein